LFFEECLSVVKHVFDGEPQNDVVADDFADFFGGDALVKVVAGVYDYGGTHGAGSDASCAGDFAFFFHAEFAYCFLEGFEDF
jgi:hypothetical protein